MILRSLMGFLLMTRDEAVSEIQVQLVFRTTLASTIISHLQKAQQDLELAPTLPWFLISEDSYIDTVSGEQRTPVPTDFLDETDEAVLRYVPTTPSASTPEVDLIKDNYDDLRKAFMDTTTGILKVGPPEAYALLGNYFRLFPTPDSTYRLRMIYYKQDTLLTTNVENQWLKYIPLLLMGKAGKKSSLGPLRDQIAWQVFSEWEAEGRRLLTTREVTRDASNKNLQVGGRH